MQQLTYEISKQRQEALGQVSHHVVPPARQSAPERIVIRLAADCDRAALRRLAALEGVELATGSWLIAKADGTLTAALRLDDGTVLADPFTRTAPLRRVLEVWASQLDGRRKRRWRPALS